MTELESALKPEVRRSPDTVTRTFRIDRDVDRKMEGRSSEGRVSKNQMANTPRSSEQSQPRPVLSESSSTI
ncbi:hypothetical protein E6H30_03400 [Candidatus Bathyarchaeota archaeon]|nr:MAG: hypothetical protein E6H30_03400 [Candidatus Bathyarchaeota archaeon]